MKKSDKIAIGTPFTVFLAILFIGLKLLGVITWSWWWVLSPLWGPPALLILGFMLFMVVINTKW